MRRLDSDEFQQDFPEEWDAFLDYPLFADDAECVMFSVDEDGLIWARFEGETVGWWEPEGRAEWVEERDNVKEVA